MQIYSKMQYMKNFESKIECISVETWLGSISRFFEMEVHSKIELFQRASRDSFVLYLI